jgi:hypothetical protein
MNDRRAALLLGAYYSYGIVASALAGKEAASLAASALFSLLLCAGLFVSNKWAIAFLFVSSTFGALSRPFFMYFRTVSQQWAKVSLLAMVFSFAVDVGVGVYCYLRLKELAKEGKGFVVTPRLALSVAFLLLIVLYLSFLLLFGTPPAKKLPSGPRADLIPATSTLSV